MALVPPMWFHLSQGVHMKILISVLVLCFSSLVMAAQNISQAQLDKMASDFYMNESSSKFQLMGMTTNRQTDPHRCEDQEEEDRGPSCSEAACQFLGSMGCNEISEIEQVGRACRGNVNGRCISSTCARLGSMGCNEMSEIEQVATVCRGNFGGRCMDTVCNLLGSMGCNEISEIQRAGVACKGVKASCIEDVCRRLGSMGCNEISEIERVASSCRGN